MFFYFALNRCPTQTSAKSVIIDSRPLEVDRHDFQMVTLKPDETLYKESAKTSA